MTTRIAGVTIGLTSMVFSLCLWHEVASTHPWELANDKVALLVVGSMVIGLAIIIGCLFFWAPITRVDFAPTRIRPIPPPIQPPEPPRIQPPPRQIHRP